MSDANRFRCLHILIDTDPHGADLSNTVDATNSETQRNTTVCG
jgi:hypothetical protein